jgi:hypothetical protein
LKNVRRGIWQIVAHVPDWLDSGHVNCALGYTYCNRYKGNSSAEILQKIDVAIGRKKPDEQKHPLVDNGLAVFQVMDPVQACIDLRQMGILAVPCKGDEIELHIIDKRQAENLANWMVNNCYELDDYPMLENLLRAHWPEPEVKQIAERATTNLVVLDYVNNKVEITQGVYEDDIEQFLEDNYGGSSAYEYMTMKTLNLQILQASC